MTIHSNFFFLFGQRNWLLIQWAAKCFSFCLMLNISEDWVLYSLGYFLITLQQNCKESNFARRSPGTRWKVMGVQLFYTLITLAQALENCSIFIHSWKKKNKAFHLDLSDSYFISFSKVVSVLLISRKPAALSCFQGILPPFGVLMRELLKSK